MKLRVDIVCDQGWHGAGQVMSSWAAPKRNVASGWSVPATPAPILCPGCLGLVALSLFFLRIKDMDQRCQGIRLSCRSGAYDQEPQLQ